MSIPKAFLVAVGAALLLGASADAAPLKVQAGYNFLKTSPGSYTTLSIPAGFFGQKNGVPSDAIIDRRVSLEGRPIGALGLSPASNIAVSAGDCHSGGGHYHCHEDSANLESVDTISRVGTVTLSEVGSTATVSLQFVALSLQTPRSAPLRVTYGGQNPTDYNLILTLDPNKTQTVGSIVLKRTSTNGGSMGVTLPVDFRVSFIGGSQTIGPVSLNAVLRSTDNTFTVQ